MRILAIETASEACSVALFEDAGLIAHDHRVLGRGHAETLVPMIAALPDKGRADRILVSLGPGSFTGVRIGIATARALGVAWGAKVLGYPTLALVAAQSDASQVTVCMNGGHGEWFVQNFAGGAAQDAVRSLAPEAARDACLHETIAGNRAEELAAMFAEAKRPTSLLPDARKVSVLSEATFTTDTAPTYGRAPDAVPQKVAGS
ncbi:tRNA (adenosine(37)-N6)-threonylcarbamoyltransferase complex dimerization subunit type 1 TsaB [uncultured Erythrobacter sp.]|uniref:tRNA (adenosine(37)-N6)-threonylcarbamoyltransferase complex dimerization subunit type 1 TsaB n=1 Tax=uncultured Erythrobacter sp. TaxID=263913 RepID=UPI0026232813|nr:tRNA (adenosine(37)-N6)-threonylcarbamoyltransferase complex dimerization subunit type 1 TsaB [uncultured Erythrobacter sp.]